MSHVTGSLLYVRGWLTFTSNRSMEVEVQVEYESRWHDPNAKGKQIAADAFFTFVSLDQDGKVQAVPPLKVRESVKVCYLL